ncbi:MAG: bifunctional (p)ppGpp synthetase/guanosine-3',5'-bis(diphosphate) 3'-pyrophosphohydrolase [Nanoarchaeota archaeon]
MLELIQDIKNYNENADFDLITKAYEFAKKSHSGQVRESGLEHISHLVGAARILVKLKADDKTIAACLLHDVLEDTNIKKEQLEKEFGQEVAHLVDGCTKIDKLRISDFKIRQAESIRKMLFATAQDIRVMIIKLADRLDNMLSLQYFPEEKQKRIAQETLDIYAPIAYRLGLFNIKWQLEDLAFSYLEPKIYQDLKEKITLKREEREFYLEKIKSILEEQLSKHDIKADIKARPKSFYSIYRKMQKKDVDFDRIFDLLGIRIITTDVKECYEILGIIHNLWKPIPKEFDDYIANPKQNMYQSLHTVVVGPEKQLFEFQIRTKEMDKIADEGIAAHWQYKNVKGDSKFDKQLSWLKEIIELKDKSSNDFFETLKLDLFSYKIYVFTPNGDIIELPKGSCPIDFAYAVHTDLGNKCRGARVNGKYVNLSRELENGDIIEIITSKNHVPSRDWLKFVKSNKAKEKIIHYFNINKLIPIKRIGNVEEGKNKLIEAEINFKDFKLGECCNPLPGDMIMGFATKNNKITVHKKDCSKLNEAKLRKINVKWKNIPESSINLKILALDRVGLFADILHNIAQLGINVEKANVNTINKDLAECNLKLELNKLEDIKKIVERINKIADVKKININ